MTASCCGEAEPSSTCAAKADDFRPIGAERRRYRPPMPVLEIIQLTGAVLVCAALIGGFLG
ncbi:hypothetical protein LQ948_01985 [Jiella sp. MQZ9-1]|uniref:Uncharacterized protein n=1 Tax=Jiella flava TaxID=2816857 RepID=A0A939FTL7_9HYPH|nr:hypothetical protein [Jiella flava]MBO0661332.1 hypothetical protein [Jiella flava]MCD2469977.1 hypothetical protein [Jiella flava]